MLIELDNEVQLEKLMSALFSKSCEYGVQAVLYLGREKNGRPLHLREIASALNLPQDFLSKILQKLSRAKILKSQKGNRGGFKLSKSANQITLGEIVFAIDEIEFLKKCVIGFAECSDSHACPLHSYWNSMREIILQMLNEKNIADLSGGIDIKIDLLKSDYFRRQSLKSA